LASLPGEPGRHLPALVHHFAEAATDGCALQAGTYALEAARQAMAKVAWEDAISYAELGLGALSTTTLAHLETRFELLLLLTETLLVPFENERARTVLREAIETARLAGSAERLARAAGFYLFFFQSDDPTVMAVAEEALSSLGDSSPGLRARLLAALAINPTRMSEGSAEPATAEALALARASGERDAVYAALVARTRVIGDMARARERLALEEELLAMGPMSGPVAGARWMHSLGRGRAVARLVLGDRAGFESDVDDVERRTAEMGSRGGQAHAALWRATLALLDGRFGEVERLASIPLGIWATRDAWAVQMGKLALEEGRAGEFRDEMARVSSVLGTHNIILRPMLAFITAEMGDHDEAGRIVDELADDEFGLATRWNASVVLAYLAEVVTALGDMARAERIYELCLPFAGLTASSGLVSHCPGAVDRYLGQLAATLGRRDQAEAHYAAALQLEIGMRAPPLVARTRYWYGRMLLERAGPGDADQARIMLRSAMETAEALGMARLAAQAAELA
jgi:tetratricopeptide (TPR) repeat protein